MLHRELQITSLTLDHPVVRLLQSRDGSWNFATFGGEAEQPATPMTGASQTPMAFSIDKLRIKDGSIELKRAVGAARNYQEVQVSADHVGQGAVFPFSMSAKIAGGGTLKLDGTLGPWHAGDAVLTPVDAHLLIHDLDLVGAGLMETGGGVGGVLDIDTQIRSASGVLQSKGHIEARQLKLVVAGTPSPRALQIDYQASYRLDAGIGKIEHSTLGTSGARLAVAGSFDNPQKVIQLNLSISGTQLPIDDLQPLLPVFGVILPKDSHLDGGSLSMNLRAQGPLDALVIRGPAVLDNTRLAGYSLGAKLSGVLALAGINAPRDTTIRHAEVTLKISPSGIDADQASAEIVDLGSLAGKGRMAADGKLDFRMLVKLNAALAGTGQLAGGLLGHSDAGRLLGGILGSAADHGIGVRVGGTASEPSFKVDPAAAVDLLNSGMGGVLNRGRANEPKAKPASKRSALDQVLRGALQSHKRD